MQKSLIKNQQGLVSILVSITFIIILALITTSFAVLMRREQRQALDRQLSTQAFYAAESGVNDAIHWIKAGNNSDITDCDDSAFPNKDLGNNLSYSCLLVDQSVNELKYADISVNDSTVVKINASSNVSKLNFSWNASDGSKVFANETNNFFPQQAARDADSDNFANHTGILRVSVTPITSNLSRQNLIDTTQTLYLYPNKDNSAGNKSTYTYSTSSSSKGQIISGHCNEDSLPNYCNVTISGLPSTKEFYVRLKSIYQSSSVEVSAEDGSGNQLVLTGAQAMIDATGKANDVLRRIQVRVPITESYDIPEFTLETADDICKLIEIRPKSNRLDNGCED